MKNKRSNVKEEGITLVALVVTIIVLLILAGVTINLALGENGLIEKTKNVTATYKEAEENDLNMLDLLDKTIEENEGLSDLEKLRQYFIGKSHEIAKTNQTVDEKVAEYTGSNNSNIYLKYNGTDYVCVYGKVVGFNSINDLIYGVWLKEIETEDNTIAVFGHITNDDEALFFSRPSIREGYESDVYDEFGKYLYGITGSEPK
ncbi:MAG: hypothetical protein IKG56_02115 [Clostridia bacterium]|nr:hypothetical protein [Clostridia bacterium]